eukprot:GEZU01020404.1.p1 GENE.GEZU01020404.1~~GEZU01020404.1.p1  ORF type:complete len:931 (-),score=290.05 GEZU01020404.1:29-2821(-)
MVVVVIVEVALQCLMVVVGVAYLPSLFCFVIFQSDLFAACASVEDGVEFKIRCSYLEIYNESIDDLFDTSHKNLKVHESPSRGVYIAGLKEEYVSCEDDVFKLIDIGTNNRVVATTQMNAVSSRSHSVFTITVEQTTADGSVKSGKLNLVDLAGSEKVGKTGASGQTLREAQGINKSLSALGLCINALVEKKPHVPFRDSKLTRILQESLGGNSRTTMICCCSPHAFNIEETISTLKFGQRAKTIKNAIKVNAIRSAAELNRMVEALTKEVQGLKAYSSNLEKQIAILKNGGDTSDLEKLGRSLLENGAAESGDTGDNSAAGTTVDHILAMQQKEEQYMREINALRDQLDDLTAKNEKQAAELEERSSKLKEVEEELEAMIDEYGKLEQKLTDEASKAEYERKQLELELETLANEVEALEASRQELKDELAKARDRVQQLPVLKHVPAATKLSDGLPNPDDRGKAHSEIERLRHLNEQLSEEIKTLKEAKLKLEEEAQQLKLDKIDLQGELRSRVESITAKDSLEQEVARLNEEMETMKAKYEAEKAETEAAMQELESEMGKLLSELEASEIVEKELNATIDELRNKQKYMEEVVIKLKLKVKREELTQQQVPNPDEELEAYLAEEYSATVNEMIDNHSKKEARFLEEFKSIRMKMDECKAASDAEIKEFSNEFERLEAELEEAKQKNARLTKSLEEAHKECALLRKEVVEASTRESKLVLERTDVEASLREANDALVASKRTISELEARIEELLVEKERLRVSADCNSLSGMNGAAGNQALQEEVRELAQQLEEMHKYVVDKEAEASKNADDAMEARRELISEKKKVTSLQQKVEFQNQRLSELEAEIASMRNTYKKYKKEAEDATRELTEVKDKLHKTQIQLEVEQKNAVIRKSKIWKPVTSNSVLDAYRQREDFGIHKLRKTEHKLW